LDQRLISNPRENFGVKSGPDLWSTLRFLLEKTVV